MDDLPTEVDEMIEEVREIRRRNWARFDNDVEKYGAYLMDLQKQHPERLWDPRTRGQQDKPAA